jgi:4'-phosphopantetheinyl transferase
MTNVYHLSIPEHSGFLACKPILNPLLSDTGRKKVELVKNQKVYAQSYLADILSRYVLNTIYKFPLEEIQFTAGPNGKPELKNQSIKFNYSHSGSQIVLAVSEKQIGIDIEKIHKNKLRVADRFFSQEEIDYIQECPDKDQAFTRLWTIKEAYLKYIGTGLTKPLQSFTVRFMNDISITEESELIDINITQFKITEDYYTAICSHEKTGKIKEVSIGELCDYAKGL